MDTTGTGITSISINTTAKYRDPPPLNVYFRVRPFIGDEVERGENQRLIDILDEKHIAVKLYPTINNTIRTLQTSYNEYEVFFNRNATDINHSVNQLDKILVFEISNMSFLVIIVNLWRTEQLS